MVPRTKTLHKKTTATLNDPQQQKTELNMFEVNIICWFFAGTEAFFGPRFSRRSMEKENKLIGIR